MLTDPACRGVDPDLFDLDLANDAERARAHVLCESCPLRRPCLAAAIAEDADGVIRGGVEFLSTFFEPAEHTCRSCGANFVRKYPNRSTSLCERPECQRTPYPDLACAYAGCGIVFTPTRPNARFCAERCYRRAERQAKKASRAA